MNERMEAPAAGRLVSIDDLHAPVRAELDRVQDELARFFHCEVRLINEIAEHVVLTVGKRMRPRFLLLVARLGAEAAATRRGAAGEPGGIPDQVAVSSPVGWSHPAIVSATIVELIHTATLVHDDSIDRSYLRRGLPTVNSIWNDQTAVIMGDYLYSKGFHLLVENNLWDVMGILAGATYRMSIGEMLELEKKRDPGTTEADYLKMMEERPPPSSPRPARSAPCSVSATARSAPCSASSGSTSAWPSRSRTTCSTTKGRRTSWARRRARISRTARSRCR